jgi:hypothetical protein
MKKLILLFILCLCGCETKYQHTVRIIKPDGSEHKTITYNSVLKDPFITTTEAGNKEIPGIYAAPIGWDIETVKQSERY